MEKEIKVESLKISIGKKEIELNIEDAKKLKKALEDIFGKEVSWWYTHYRPVTTPTPSYPYWWGTMTCGNFVDKKWVEDGYKDKSCHYENNFDDMMGNLKDSDFMSKAPRGMFRE